MCGRTLTGGVGPREPIASNSICEFTVGASAQRCVGRPRGKLVARPRVHEDVEGTHCRDTFHLAEELPAYVRRHTKDAPLAPLYCDDMFDAFLAHEAARVASGGLAPSALQAHRQILDHTWRPAIGRRPFLSVRYSQLQKIADAQADSFCFGVVDCFMRRVKAPYWYGPRRRQCRSQCPAAEGAAGFPSAPRARRALDHLSDAQSAAQIFNPAFALHPKGMQRHRRCMPASF